MARPSLSAFTIAKLQSMLEQQQAKKRELLRERSKLESQLERLDRQIATLDGAAVGGTNGHSGGVGGRPRNEKSLVTVLEEVLAKSPKGMAVGDIVEAVQAAGYKSSSAKFRGIVNQTLIKEGKTFQAVERGVYSLKK